LHDKLMKGLLEIGAAERPAPEAEQLSTAGRRGERKSCASRLSSLLHLSL
jgi:hypothetical protein